MQKNTFILNIIPPYDVQNYFPNSKILFFDIETTGFSANTTILYLIGCAYKDENNQWKILQWFNDDGKSELDILKDFYKFTKNFTHIFHYNGNGFDIPYILHKYNYYCLDYDFKHLVSVDIYKLISPYKKFFNLENLKQKTIEKFLNITRNDKFDGGQLINIYNKFIKFPTKELYDILILHNFEDIQGLLLIIEIFSYLDIFNNKWKINSFNLQDNNFIIFIELNNYIGNRISISKQGIKFSAFQKIAKFSIPIYSGELKYFFKDYKNYYYLPHEDKAIHKSVAFFVDKDFKTKAKPTTCYSKKTGLFLPQFEEITSEYFKLEYNDTITYFEINDNIFKDISFFRRYILHILEFLKK